MGWVCDLLVDDGCIDGMHGGCLVWLGAVVWECSCALMVLLGLVVEGHQFVAVLWNMVL